MPLQAKMSQGDQRLYNPSRDVAHTFADIIKEVARRIDLKMWPEMQEFLAKQGLRDAEVGAALQIFTRFVADTNVPREPMWDALERHGWYEVEPAAQIVIMAYLGQLYTGMAWVGIREATLGGEGPLKTCQDMFKAGQRGADLLSIPAWKRPWVRRWRRLKRAFQVMRDV